MKRPISLPLRCARAILAPLFVVVTLIGLAVAQPAGRSSLASEPTQLDRIERKLDEVLQRLQGSPVRPDIPSPAPSSSSAPTTTEGEFRPGALAVVHAAPARVGQLAEVPADSVGGFVYAGGALTLHDLSNRGVRYTGFAGIELQGWLKVVQAGRYQIGEDLRAVLGPSSIVGPECILQAWLEDRAIGTERAQLTPSSGRDARATLVLGAELQPGLYKIRLWTACLPSRDTRVSAEILIKAPSDLNLRGIAGEDILHRPG